MGRIVSMDSIKGCTLLHVPSKEYKFHQFLARFPNSTYKYAENHLQEDHYHMSVPIDRGSKNCERERKKLCRVIKNLSKTKNKKNHIPNVSTTIRYCSKLGLTP